MSDLFLVRDAVQRSAKWLGERGIPTPRLDAELLLAHVLGCKRLDLFMNPERPLDDEERDTYRALITRRANHEPVAYLIGVAGFWKIDVDIDARALIPRPETERIIEIVLQAAGDRRDHPLRIVDIGCGSGILAISLALEFPNAQVVAVDISEDALALTAQNALKHDVRDRVHPIRGDLLDTLIAKGSKADIIVSNPPYIGESERALMSEGVETWEPMLALFGGEDGFEIIDRLLPQIPRVLDTGGIFAMEFGSPQGDGMRERAARRFRSWRIERDYSGHDRVLVVDAPGERQWASPAPSSTADEDAETPALDHSDPLVEAPTDAGLDSADAFQHAGLFGGADGRERLPEIDLHGDLEENS